MSSLGKKLGLEAGARVLLISAPKVVRDQLVAAPQGAKVTTRGRGPFGVVLGFAVRQREVARLFKQAHAVLSPAGDLWIAYPRKSSGVRTDLDRNHGWDALRERGWAPLGGMRIDETWAALHFRHDPALKARHVAKRLKRAAELPTLKIKKGSTSKTTVTLRRDEIDQATSQESPRRKDSAEGPGRPSSNSALVRTPPDLRDALAPSPQAKKRWSRLSPARKRDLLAFIEEVKTTAARARRVEKTVAELAEP